MSTRRTFILQTLATGSAMMWLPGCADHDALGDDHFSRQRGYEVESADFATWRKLARLRVEQANAHDLSALMGSYSSDATLVVNGVRHTGAALRQQLEQLGFGASGGALANARLTTDAEFLTEEEILHRGRLSGKHVAPLFGFPGLDREVTIAFAAFRRFTRDERLVSERLVLNLGVLNPNLILLNA